MKQASTVNSSIIVTTHSFNLLHSYIGFLSFNLFFFARYAVSWLVLSTITQHFYPLFILRRPVV